MKAGIFDYHQIKPLERFGLVHNFWTIHIDTLVYTWAAMLILLILAIVGNIYLKRKTSYVSLAYEKSIGMFIDLCIESFGTFKYNYFAFVSTLFFFTLFCCLTGLLPFLDESTKDLNTTFALGLTSFLYVQYQKIKVHGILGFCKEFLQPFFLLAPINIVGELAKIASMSFRLFGNILGGGIIFTMLVNLVEQYAQYFLAYSLLALIASLLINQSPLLKKNKWAQIIANSSLFLVFFLTWTQMFFGLFEGMIQAFVLTMLTITYLSMGTTQENDNTPPNNTDAPKEISC